MALHINQFFDSVSKVSKIQRVLIFVGTVVILVGLFIWFIYLPKTKDIARLKTNITNLENQIALAKVKAKNLKKLEEEYAGIQQELSLALKLLPTSSEIPTLLENITKLGNESHLDFILFSPKKEVSKQFYVEIPVSIEVNGGYHDVAVFFDKVGKLDRIVNVMDVSMKPAAKDNTDLHTSCTAVTYRFKEKVETTSVPKKAK
jgi:type IV pilus assembly protein PilO